MAYLGEGGMYVAVGQQSKQMIPGRELSDVWPLVKWFNDKLGLGLGSADGTNDPRKWIEWYVATGKSDLTTVRSLKWFKSI